MNIGTLEDISEYILRGPPGSCLDLTMIPDLKSNQSS